MNDYSSYSSAPPSEASAQCQSTIENVKRWLQQHQTETEINEIRSLQFEAELTRRLSMLRATGGSTTPSLTRSEQSGISQRPHMVQLTRQPFASQRVWSTTSSSNKRGCDSGSASSSKQPRISDPTLPPEIPFQPGPGLPVPQKEDGVAILTPPSSATHSTDNAPPLPPRESNTSSTTVVPVADNSAPPLPPRPPALVTSGVELHMSSPTPSSSNNVEISVHVSKPKQWHGPFSGRPVFDGRGYSMPPAPPCSTTSSINFSPDARVHSLPPGAPGSYRTNSNNLLRHQVLQKQIMPNGSPVPFYHWSQPMSSTGLSTTSQSHAVSNLNYSVFPEHSQIGLDSHTISNCGSLSIAGSNNYAFYGDDQPFGGQVSSRMMYVQGSQRRPREVVSSPLPERRQRNSARIEDGAIIGRESYSNSRTYSSEAYKFYMEQHVENLIKSCAQRKERQQHFEAFMTSQNLNLETERRPFRLLHAKRESNYLRLKRARLQPSFFGHLKTLGIGAFGEVSLVRQHGTDKLYAMKTLRKADVIKRNQVAHVKAERDILAEANSDWVVKLFFSFQDRENLYFIMDYIPGGDLMNLLIKKGVFPEPMARFYTAELVAALEYVHSMGFIHRDIKPDNVLIDREGHVKLTDFGLCTGFRWTHQSNRYAKIRPEEPIWFYAPTSHVDIPEAANNMASSLTLPHRHQRVHSLVGTPNYIAPEVVLKSGYNHSCDWWSVGVILYEMLVGRPPFLSDSPAQTQYKIIHWKNYLAFPYGVSLSASSADLISALIRDADSRLGASGGAAEIKSHPFFNNVDFDNLRRQPAVYVPILKNEMDTSNFDPSAQGGQQSLTDETVGSAGIVGPAAFSFYEFTFRRFCDDAGCPLPMPASLSSPTYASVSSPTTAQPAAEAAARKDSSTTDTTVVTSKPPLPPPLPPRPSASQQKQHGPTVQPSVPAKPLPSLATDVARRDKNPTFV